MPKKRHGQKANLTEQLVNVLGVAPQALAVPDIDINIGLMHTFFALEDLYGIKIGEIDGEMCFRVDTFHKEYKYLLNPFMPRNSNSIFRMQVKSQNSSMMNGDIIIRNMILLKNVHLSLILINSFQRLTNKPKK